MLKNYISLLFSVIFGCATNNTSGIIEPRTTKHADECVVLLHGIGRSKHAMHQLEKYLSDKGYNTLNIGYPSTRKTIQAIAKEELPPVIEECHKYQPTKIHFVTHSMGSIIIRQYLQTHSLPEGSRIVMLGPPNHGSEIADFMKNFFLYKWLYGPAGQQLGTEPDSVPNCLQPINAEIGIITGNLSFNPFFSMLIPGPDDGKVSVESAKLKEMTDFLVVRAGHTFIMNNSDVMRQIAYFLEYGKFDKE